jgi:ribose 5-phosphate isomerase B
MTKLVSEQTVLEAVRTGNKVITISEHTIITPAARDAAHKHNIQFVTPASLPPRDSVTAQPPANVHVFTGSDHGGFELKEQLKTYISGLGYTVEDLGTFSTDSVDYPDFALKVAQSVAGYPGSVGIIVDGAGIGSAITANKVTGIRAASCQDVYTARNSKAHNNANILTLGSRVLGPDIANEIVSVWLSTAFEGGRHKQRVDKILAIERTYNKG